MDKPVKQTDNYDLREFSIKFEVHSRALQVLQSTEEPWAERVCLAGPIRPEGHWLLIPDLEVAKRINNSVYFE